MSQHTPGPWVKALTGQVMHSYSQPIAIAQQSAANMVAGVFDDVSGGRDVADANARLIAAAPDLLAALEKMVAVHDEPCRFDHNGYCQSHYLDHQVDGCLVQIARDAIKKARGE